MDGQLLPDETIPCIAYSTRCERGPDHGYVTLDDQVLSTLATSTGPGQSCSNSASTGVGCSTYTNGIGSSASATIGRDSFVPITELTVNAGGAGGYEQGARATATVSGTITISGGTGTGWLEANPVWEGYYPTYVTTVTVNGQTYASNSRAYSNEYWMQVPFTYGQAFYYSYSITANSGNSDAILEMGSVDVFNFQPTDCNDLTCFDRSGLDIHNFFVPASIGYEVSGPISSTPEPRTLPLCVFGLLAIVFSRTILFRSLQLHRFQLSGAVTPGRVIK